MGGKEEGYEWVMSNLHKDLIPGHLSKMHPGQWYMEKSLGG